MERGKLETTYEINEMNGGRAGVSKTAMGKIGYRLLYERVPRRSTFEGEHQLSAVLDNQP
jgi:hypothetical protein